MANSSIIWLDTSEGPFDLLLEMVRREKIDISRVSLGAITDNFLTYIQETAIQPEILADFILVASTLLLIKIQRLLPKLSKTDEEEIDSLTERIAYYKLYRDKARLFAKKWPGLKLFPAHYLEDPAKIKPQNNELPNIKPLQLQQAMLSVIKRTPKEAMPTRHLVSRGKSLQQCLAIFRDRLKTHVRFSFQETVANEHPQTIAMSFLAVLELARTQQISLTQEHYLAPISIQKKS